MHDATRRRFPIQVRIVLRLIGANDYMRLDFRSHLANRPDRLDLVACVLIDFPRLADHLDHVFACHTAVRLHRLPLPIGAPDLLDEKKFQKVSVRITVWFSMTVVHYRFLP